MLTQKQFYKSKQWLDFRKVIVANRTDADGFVHCSRCGKPIVNKYDLIIHHKQELNDLDCNDASVALSPDNVECVCFHCHNAEHNRFVSGHDASYKRRQKKVYIVYGSPASGKSTWVNEHAGADDLIVDMDNIWEMISNNDRYVKPDTLKAIAFQVRDTLYDSIKYRNGKWHNAFVITGGALKGDRQRLKQRIGADGTVVPSVWG